ncbi:unnamed protein product [Heligmosomoides polygyrus]|uniref:ANK_REP_REGION domain-containing protein n=1 Tax=Heligmosomoides polygyrus TaxID=6339 RepID=A0A3P7Y3H9_HELPZ|nr:unnamed protein product [Heligmosomoides polygyrus]
MDQGRIRTFVYYEWLLGNDTGTAVANICRACKEDAVSQHTVRRWFNRFKSGDTSIEDREHPLKIMLCCWWGAKGMLYFELLPQGRTSGDLLEFCIKADIRAVDEECRKEDVNPNIQDAEGNTPLIIAAEAGHTAIVELLLARFPHLEIDHVNHLGQSALMKAAIQGRITCARALLRAGADTSLRDFSRSFRALDWAEYVGRTECVHMIAHFMVKSPKPTRPTFSAMISDLQNVSRSKTL